MYSERSVFFWRQVLAPIHPPPDVFTLTICDTWATSLENWWEKGKHVQWSLACCLLFGTETDIRHLEYHFVNPLSGKWEEANLKLLDCLCQLRQTKSIPFCCSELFQTRVRLPLQRICCSWRLQGITEEGDCNNRKKEWSMDKGLIDSRSYSVTKCSPHPSCLIWIGTIWLTVRLHRDIAEAIELDEAG